MSKFTQISGTKGAWSTSRDLLLQFWDPLYISGTDKARNFKFGVRIDRCLLYTSDAADE